MFPLVLIAKPKVFLSLRHASRDTSLLRWRLNNVPTKLMQIHRGENKKTSLSITEKEACFFMYLSAYINSYPPRVSGGISSFYRLVTAATAEAATADHILTVIPPHQRGDILFLSISYRSHSRNHNRLHSCKGRRARGR